MVLRPDDLPVLGNKTSVERAAIDMILVCRCRCWNGCRLEDRDRARMPGAAAQRQSGALRQDDAAQPGGLRLFLPRRLVQRLEPERAGAPRPARRWRHRRHRRLQIPRLNRMERPSCFLSTADGPGGGRPSSRAAPAYNCPIHYM